MATDTTVHQRVYSTDLCTVYEQRDLNEVTDVFEDAETMFQKMYGEASISQYPSQVPAKGTFIVLHGRCGASDSNKNTTCLIEGKVLATRAVAALETSKTFAWASPVSFQDHFDGLASFNKFFDQHGIKYVQSKEHFIKAPAKKVKPCPKAAINSIKKDIVECGRQLICKLTGASIVKFGVSTTSEVDGAAYLAKEMGFNYKAYMFWDGWTRDEDGEYKPKLHLGFEQHVDKLVQIKSLTVAQRKELVVAIDDWWKGLAAPPKAE